MTPERWARVKELFEQAAERDSAERAAWLAEACGGDDELRAEVASLLASDEAPATVFERPLAEVLGEMLPAAPAADRRLGAYRTVREIGRGGMAVVYAAVRDDDQYEKQVAIKLIKRGMDTDAIIARFLTERQILANLEHPNIARLLDGGMSDDGLPYLVMEAVEGEPIDAYCDRLDLAIEERLRLFREVCAAVHFAHRNLVVHRDLKPSNILVTADGVPKLLDFGIAKVLGDDLGQPPEMTVAGLRPMTPGWASPEQIRGQPITTASDVYALGALLFKLLTGQRPYPLGDLTPQQVEQAICEQDPVRPSAIVGQPVGSPEAPSEGRSDRKKLRRQLSGDLDNIVLKALKRVPEERYGSGEQLSEDIRRYLDGLPVIAQPDVLAYRTRKFVRRHRWGVAAVGVIFLSLVAGIVATAWQARVAKEERATAEGVSAFLVNLFETPRPDKALGETITARELLDRGAMRIRGELGNQPKVRAQLMDSIGVAYLKLGLYEESKTVLQEALELRRGALGERHPLVAASLNHLGEVLTAQGQYQDAEVVLRKALALRREQLGTEHELVAESLNDLAVAIYRRGRAKDAEPLLRKALALRRRVYGQEHPQVAHGLNNLALVLKAQGRFDEAANLYREALVMNRRLLAEEHPAIAVNLNNLAEVLRAEGRCEEAIDLYRETLQLERKLLGDKHPDLATTQNNLAGCLGDLGRYDQAESHFLDSLEIRRLALGEAHPAVASSLNNLARIFFARGDLAEAANYYRAALELNRELHGSEHPDVATNLSNLAITLEEQGDLAAAEELFRDALRVHRQMLGDEHLTIADSRHKLAEFLLRSGQARAAEVEFLAALEVRRRLLPSPSRELARTLLGLARALTAAGEPRRAAAYFEESLELWRQWPEEWRMRAGTQSLLGSCLTTLGRYSEAESLLVESSSVFQEKTGGGQTTRRALGRLIELYEAWDRPQDAARYRALLPD